MGPGDSGPTVCRLPSSRPCSPTAPRGKAQGTAGSARSECDLLTKPHRTQRCATGSAAVHVSSRGGEPWNSRKFQPEPGRAEAVAVGPGTEALACKGQEASDPAEEVASLEDVRGTLQGPS